MMEKRHPLDGSMPDWLKEYGPSTEIGRILRQSDAKALLEKLKQAEGELERQQQLDLQIENECQMISAQSATAVQFLLRYGIDPDDLAAFQHILGEITQHGGLTLREAARLAHARNCIQSSNAEPLEPSL